MTLVGPMARAAQSGTCQKIVMKGEVKAGQEWKAPIGEGWVFRVLPIQSGSANYSGWDLVVDREQPAGFPDALLLASPPYDSINEREVGTTFGVRAQDAVGWNPRSFRFLTDVTAFREGQKLFLLRRQRPKDPSSRSAMQQLMELAKQSAAGEFHILDAHLVPGIADAAPFAQNWAIASTKAPHTFEQDPAGKSTPLGNLRWVRFSVTLWLPDSWKSPPDVHPVRGACSE